MSPKRAFMLLAFGSLIVAHAQALPPADAGVPAPTSEAALTPDAQKRAWLTGKLIGGDNRMAARRVVQIEMREGRYRIFIKNQFALRCQVEFDAAGDPTQLTECKSGDSADWDATGPIALSCREQAGGRICSGKWRSKNGIIAPDTLSFQRVNARTAPKRRSGTSAESARKKAERDCRTTGRRCIPDMVVSDDF